MRFIEKKGSTLDWNILLIQLFALFSSSIRQKDLELKELKDTLQGLYSEGKDPKQDFIGGNRVSNFRFHAGEKMSQEQGKDRKKIKEMKAKETKLEKDKTEVTEKLDQANKRVESLQLDLKAAERYKGLVFCLDKCFFPKV